MVLRIYVALGDGDTMTTTATTITATRTHLYVKELTVSWGILTTSPSGGKKIDALNTEHGNCYEKSKNCVLWVHIKGTPKQTLETRKASQRKVISKFRPERWMRVGWLNGAGEAKMLRGLRKFCLNYSWKAHLANLDGVGQLTSGFWNLNFSSLSDTSAWAQVMLRSLQFQRNVGKWEDLVD